MKIDRHLEESAARNSASIFVSKIILIPLSLSLSSKLSPYNHDSYNNHPIRRNMVQGVRIDDKNCLVNTNPATGEIISRVKCTTPEELGEIIDAAKTSQKEWRKTSLEERIGILKDCIKELAAVSDPMIELIVREMGKPIAEAKEEMEYAVVDQDAYFDILLDSLKPKTYGKSTVVRQPYGVVAIMR